MFRVIVSGAIILVALLSYNLFDLPVAIYFQDLKGDKIYEFFHFLTKFGQLEYYLIPALMTYIYYRYKDPFFAMKAKFVFVSLVLSGIIVLLIKIIGGRFRPEMYFKEDAFGFDFFHLSHTMTSFPSGHSATSMGAAAAFALLFPKFRLFFYLFGLLVMISRVVIVRHYPSDIMIGALIGVLTSFVLYERFYKRSVEDAT